MAKSIPRYRSELRRELAALKRKIRPFYKAMGEITRSEREKDFEQGRGPDGQKWQPLHPKTIERKAKRHTSQRIKRKGGISGLASVRTKASPTPSKPLMDQGILKGLDVKVEQNRLVMRPWKSRREVVTSGGESIAGIHEKRYKGRPRRHHWGFPVAAEKRIIAAWNALLSEFLRRV